MKVDFYDGMRGKAILKDTTVILKAVESLSENEPITTSEMADWMKRKDRPCSRKWVSMVLDFLRGEKRINGKRVGPGRGTMIYYRISRRTPGNAISRPASTPLENSEERFGQ